MLKCADGTYYTGHTDNIEKRVAEHQSGAFRGYTYERRPVELVWTDYFNTRDDAQLAETKLKGWSRAKKEALIAKNRDRLKKLAMPPSERSARASASLGIVPRLRLGKRDGTGSDNVRGRTPIIILVRPQLGENIGKAARAMLNFGLTELRLVAPRDGWPNPDAGPAAAGADVVLERAQVFNTLAEATADIANIYATTVRKRGVTKPVVTPEVAASEIIVAPGRSAILFGAERSGLETEDVAVARSIITVPINPEFGSLNLAQAVILCAYEWSKHQGLASPPKVELDPPAPQAELDGMIDQLFGQLEERNFFFPAHRAAATKLTLRNLLTKPGWNSLEVRTLRGVFRAFTKTR